MSYVTEDSSRSKTLPTLTVVAGKRVESAILATRVPLNKASSGRAIPGTRLSTLLHLPPGADETTVIVTQWLRDHSEELVGAFKVRAPTTPFEFFLDQPVSGAAPCGFVPGGSCVLLDPVSIPAIKSRLATVREPGKVTSLAFLLDGTMEGARFEEARKFILSVASDLAGSDPPLRLACVVYAEYLFRCGDKRIGNWAYECLTHPFSGQSEFKAFVKSALPARVIDDDPCDALELGLQEARKLQWRGDARMLVVIGNSPPHPTKEERVQNDLLDRETEQHQGIIWTQELERLFAMKVNRGSVWMRPERYVYSQTPDWRHYAEAVVWRKLGQELFMPNVDSAAAEVLATYIRQLRSTEFVIDPCLPFPLITALTTTIPVGWEA